MGIKVKYCRQIDLAVLLLLALSEKIRDTKTFKMETGEMFFYTGWLDCSSFPQSQQSADRCASPLQIQNLSHFPFSKSFSLVSPFMWAHFPQVYHVLIRGG